jgi:NAD(P)-dependent dehydrogenase (short-subunit alcohol dehydrogenase family)
MDFSARTAIVTGGMSGIGAAVVEGLRVHGASPVIWDRTRGSDIPVDVSDSASVSQAMAQTITRFGVPSILVTAAGIAANSPLLEQDVDEWDRLFAVNTRGTMLCYQAAARAMRDAGLDGAMVGVASVQSVLSDPYVAGYSASKAALVHLSRIAAVELGPYGIRVNAVGPGPTRTPMLQGIIDADESYLHRVEQNTPLGQIGTPELVADAIINILRSDWLTGQVIMLDGGASLLSARGWASAKARIVGIPQ